MGRVLALDLDDVLPVRLAGAEVGGQQELGALLLGGSELVLGLFLLLFSVPIDYAVVQELGQLAGETVRFSAVTQRKLVVYRQITEALAETLIEALDAPVAGDVAAAGGAMLRAAVDDVLRTTRVAAGLGLVERVGDVEVEGLGVSGTKGGDLAVLTARGNVVYAYLETHGQSSVSLKGL